MLGSGNKIETLTLQPDATAGKDAVMLSSLEANNRGIDPYCYVGESANATDAIYRSLIQFDLSSIPATAKVQSATLTLWRTFDRSTNARVMSIYRLKRAWVEGTKNNAAPADGATWVTYDGVNSWGFAGCSNTTSDREAASIGTYNAPAGTNAGAITAVEVNITLTASKVQDWIDGTLTNNGMLLQMATETNDMWGFDSSDSANTTQRPRLTVVYK